MARDQVSAFEKALVDEGIAGTQLEDIARSIHQQESGKGKNTKTSNAGAVGQMQIVPRTFKAYHPTGNIKDPYDNAVGGLRYIKDLATKAGDDIGLVAAGYYGGPKAMAKAKVGEALGDKKNPNAPNTLQYMEQVMSRVKPGEKTATAQGSEKPSWFRSPVPKFIRSEAPNLGTGYNAALALMGMSDDELEKAQETVAQNEEDNAVADFGQAKQMLAGIQAPNAFANRQPMRMMAKGGEVQHYADGGFTVPMQRNIYRPEDQKYLDEQLAAWNKYNEQANVYNRKLAEYQGSAPVKEYATAAETYNARLKEYNANVYEPYKAQVDSYNAKLAAFNESPEFKAYQQQVTDYNNALNEYNTNVYSPYKAQVDQYNTGLEAFKNSEPYRNYISSAEAYNASVDAYNNAPTRTVAEQVYYGRAPGGPGYLGDRFVYYRASGPGQERAWNPNYEFVNTNPAVPYFGNVITKDVTKPTGFNMTAPTYDAAAPTAPSAFDRAAPTEVAFGEVAPTKPEDFTIAPPAAPPGFGEVAPTQPGESIDAVMARKAKADEIAVKDAEQRGIAIQVANNPNQYNLAGFGAAGINAPTIALMAEGGEVAPEPEKGSAKAMLKEVGRSTQYAPADLAGSPVDLINLGLKGVDAMTGSKLASELPVGGAEWLIDKANKYGLMDKPTGSMTETLTRFATGIASPAGVAKGVATVGNKAASMSRKALDEAYELSGMSRAKKTASEAVPETPAVPTKETIAPAYTERVPDKPKGEARSMLNELDPAIQKLINEPRIKGFEGPQQPKRTLTEPTRDRPFVSPLDKFFAQGNNPVTVEQLTNQLAKGSRDYEMNRVAQLLEGKSPKDKIRPSDLLRQLEETSPARFKVEIKEPDPKNMDQFHARMENPFPSKPMGTVNLLEDITPQEKLAQSYLEDMKNKQLYRYKGSSSYSPQEKDTAAKQLEVFFGSPMAKNIVGENLASSFKRDVPEIRQLRSKIDEIRSDMSDISYPTSQGTKYGFDSFKEYQKLSKEAYEKYPEIEGIKDVGERLKKLSDIVDPVLKNNAENAILTGLDKKYGTNLVAHRESLGADWDKLSGYEKSKITERMMGDLVGGDLTKSIKRFDEIERPYRDAVAKALSQNEIYKGQHSSIAKDKPISFSRFQDVTLPTKENVMVIPELQSDRYDDLLKKGATSGSHYKDMDELGQLEQKLDSVTRKTFKAEDAAARDKLNLESKKIQQRIINLRERIQAGDYSTPEFTPGIERMPQVMQQIMLKNAVSAGIQRGKNGVLFPGSDSAQAQLYEKLPNNIRAVIKDLGPGFEMRKVPLQYENGSTMDRYGIFWQDDAAKRISKEGVRFKNGGMVDKNDDENQKYI